MVSSAYSKRENLHRSQSCGIISCRQSCRAVETQRLIAFFLRSFNVTASALALKTFHRKELSLQNISGDHYMLLQRQCCQETHSIAKNSSYKTDPITPELQSARDPEHQSIRAPEHQSTRALEFQSPRASEHPNPRASESRAPEPQSSRAPESQSPSAPEHQSTRVPEPIRSSQIQSDQAKYKQIEYKP